TAYLSVATQANNSLNDQSDGTFDLTEGNFTKNHLQIANITLNSAFSPTLLNQLTAGWQYWNNLIDSTTRTPLVTFPNAQFGNNTGNGMSIAVGDPHFIIKDAKQLGLYFQDDWKVTRRFTLNIGLRWDKDYDFIGGSDISGSRTFQELQAAAPFSPLAASLVAKKASDYSKNFSPRVGFAFDLTGHGNHVLRGGYGMYYGNTFQNIPLFMEQQSNATIFQTAFAISGTDAVPGVPSCGSPSVSPCTLNVWRYGVDPMPTIPPPSHDLAGGTPAVPGATGRVLDPTYRNPVTEEWN